MARDLLLIGTKGKDGDYYVVETGDGVLNLYTFYIVEQDVQ